MKTKDKKKKNERPKTAENFLDMIGFKLKKKPVKKTYLCLRKNSGYFRNFKVTL